MVYKQKIIDVPILLPMCLHKTYITGWWLSISEEEAIPAALIFKLQLCAGICQHNESCYQDKTSGKFSQWNVILATNAKIAQPI